MTILNLTTSGIPYLTEYFGVWAMEDRAFAACVELIDSMNLAEHLSRERREGTNGAIISGGDGVAVIQLRGLLMKQEASFSESTSTVKARRALRAAAADPDVGSIMLHIESPGGTFNGMPELAQEIQHVRAKKKIEAYIEDLGASAAYWAASMCSKVYANQTAAVGSIGTYSVIHDLSAKAAQQGVKVHVIRAGAFKGAGEPGTEITAEHLAEFHRLTSQKNDFFVRGVAEGRGMSLASVRELADGRVHLAADAVSMGLIDGIKTFEQALSDLQKSTFRKSEKRSTKMHASIKEIKSACPGIDDAFAVKLLEKESTLDHARDEWMLEQGVRLESQAKEIATLKADLAVANEKADKTAKESTGVDPLEEKQSKADAGGDVREQWASLVAEKVKEGMPKAKAIQSVVRANPQLHKDYLASFNSK